MDNIIYELIDEIGNHVKFNMPVYVESYKCKMPVIGYEVYYEDNTEKLAVIVEPCPDSSTVVSIEDIKFPKLKDNQYKENELVNLNPDHKKLVEQDLVVFESTKRLFFFNKKTVAKWTDKKLSQLSLAILCNNKYYHVDSNIKEYYIYE